MELARVQSEINRLFDNLLEIRTAGAEAVAGKWTPNADVLETRDQMIVRFELPGIDGGSIRLAVAGGNLIVSGRKPAPDAGAAARVHSSERGQGEFRRLIHLGVSINPNKAAAEIRDGLLTVVLPKVANRRGEEVTISVREGSGAHGE
jgi:HSP20 family protein